MKWFTILALALAIGLATAASPFASSSSDGLERVAGDKGFAARGESRDAPVFDYGSDSKVATGVAGFAGTLIVFALAGGVAMVVRRR
jgi:PDGLE domain-containing protein